MDLRTVLVLATVLGFVITILGLVAAWYSARKEFDHAQARIDKMEELAKAELEDNPPPPGDRSSMILFMGRDEKWDAIYAQNGLTRPTYDNTVFLAAYESRRLLCLVLNSTRRDFLIAVGGLLISTAASVGSLFLVA